MTGRRHVDTGYGRGQGAGGERRRRAGGDEPVRGRPAPAGLPAADHGARADLAPSTVTWSTRREAFEDYRRGRRRPGRVRGEAHGLAGGRAGRRDGDGAGPFGVATGACVHPYRPAVLRRRRVDRELLARLRAAVDAAGLWDELGTDWLLLDCELLPWSAKADELIREQYAAVGAAGRAALPAALAALDAAASAAGCRWPTLRDPTRARAANAERVHRRPTGATAGPPRGWTGSGWRRSRCSPARAASYADRDHGWHLALADRLVRGRPGAASRRPGGWSSTLADAAAVAAATAWWLELTGAGGEGMVVKPYAGPAPGRRRRRWSSRASSAGAGSTCGSSTAPTTPSRRTSTGCGDRSLGRKRSLALREYALGLEALDRLAAGEPLWRGTSRCSRSSPGVRAGRPPPLTARPGRVSEPGPGPTARGPEAGGGRVGRVVGWSRRPFGPFHRHPSSRGSPTGTDP